MEALADSEFRLLILLPGNRNEPLRCHLRTSTLNEHLPYEALSYAWDDSADTVAIEVAGEPLTITRSLETILFRLRSPSQPRVLWIDQLCIDQSNPAEKTAQVQKMRSIYSICKRVLVWLGEIADGVRREEAEDALAFLEHLAAFECTWKGSKRPYPQRPKFMESMESFESAMRALSTIGVIQHRWWHRVWTVQEAILPNEVTFVWGPLSLAWDTILSATWAW